MGTMDQARTHNFQVVSTYRLLLVLPLLDNSSEMPLLLVPMPDSGVPILVSEVLVLEVPILVLVEPILDLVVATLVSSLKDSIKVVFNVKVILVLLVVLEVLPILVLSILVIMVLPQLWVVLVAFLFQMEDSSKHKS